MNVDNPFMESYSKQKQKRRRAEERREIESKGFVVVVVVLFSFVLWIGGEKLPIFTLMGIVQ